MGIESVIQLHRLLALAGFTRFEAVTSGIHGEYDSDVERAAIVLEPGSFRRWRTGARGCSCGCAATPARLGCVGTAVRERLDALGRGDDRWALQRQHGQPFPGGLYVLLHTLSHPADWTPGDVGLSGSAKLTNLKRVGLGHSGSFGTAGSARRGRRSRVGEIVGVHGES